MTWSCRTVIVTLLCRALVCDAHGEIVGADDARPTAARQPWTIVAMAPDGSWGVATAAFIYQGIAQAVSNCKRMSGQKIGCGAQLQVVQSGWIVVTRCNDMNIIAAGTLLADAANSVAAREKALRLNSAQVLSTCRHVITVDPHGAVLRVYPGDSWDGSAALRSD
jgi:hypothetical protein